MCHVFAAAQIHLKPLILIIVPCRPGSDLPTTFLKVQSSLYGRVFGIPLGRRRNLSVGDLAAFHSKRIPAFFAKETTAKQSQIVSVLPYKQCGTPGVTLTFFRPCFYFVFWDRKGRQLSRLVKASTTLLKLWQYILDYRSPTETVSFVSPRNSTYK